MAICDFADLLKYRLSLVGAMQYEDWMIFVVFAAQVVLLAWQINQKKQLIVDDLQTGLEGLIDDLDGRLAEALQSVMQNAGLQGMEPVNPFQALLANYLQMKMTENVPGATVVIPRGDDGKFSETPKDDKQV